jgi:2-polyprenyl-3-methyl-5-hydroxy-6-metoxy-1,4-benzoquinol methylase
MSVAQKRPAAREPWPSADLEQLGHCPLCGSRQRTLLYSGLTDDTFYSALGQWSLWRCAACDSAYLDPRPDARSIGRAYEHYYTHEDVEPLPDASFIGRWRTRLGNGYRNARYGLQLEPSSRLGPIVAALLPPLRWPADLALRYLPAAKPGSRVLDFGCGSGGWLKYPRQARWEVAGVDPDPKARQLGREQGYDIRETLEEFDGESFDAITLSHSIEHVHDPLATLRACRALLKPGGMIYVDTPNINAVGHHIYGRHWRGLETPRHLVLFNRESLRLALEQAGFGRIRFRWRFYPFAGMARLSQLIAAGLDPYSGANPPADARQVGLRDTIQAHVSRNRTEFLTVTASPRP